MSRSIVIAINKVDIANQIKQLLIHNGFQVLGVCTSGNEAIQKARILKPQLLIVNFELPDITGIEVARILTEDKVCSVILLINQGQKEYAAGLRGDLDVVCIHKPFNRTTLIHTADLLLRSRRKIKHLEEELKYLKDNLETRKITDRAKGLLMDKQGLSEAEAYRSMQKQSMDSGLTIKEVAKRIIQTLI